MRLRVNWFTPHSPATNPGFLASVLPELSRELDLEFWAPSPASVTVLEKYGRNRAEDSQPGSRTPWQEANSADLNVFQISDDAGISGLSWQLLAETTGLVILHGAGLQRLARGVYLDQLGDFSRYLRLMTVHYGETGARAAYQVREGAVEAAQLNPKFPLLPEIGRLAQGLVLDSREGLAELARDFPDLSTLGPAEPSGPALLEFIREVAPLRPRVVTRTLIQRIVRVSNFWLSKGAFSLDNHQVASAIHLLGSNEPALPPARFPACPSKFLPQWDF